MFGIDSSELLLIAIVALVVIGPKELPGLLRTWGKWMAQMRGMASMLIPLGRPGRPDDIELMLTAPADNLVR